MFFTLFISIVLSIEQELCWKRTKKCDDKKRKKRTIL